MAQPFVSLSHTTDGSMRNRNDPHDTIVIENREQWLAQQGIAVQNTTRVNVTFTDGDDFCRYVQVDESQFGKGMRDDDIVAADALVTTTPGQALFLPIADCVATTIYDEEHGVLMLSHLGRHSLEQQGGLKSVQYLQQHFGSNPQKLKIWLSPTVNKEVYKIFKCDNKGMKEVLYEQLEAAGIDWANVTDNTDDTATNDNYFSYSEFLKGNKPADGCYAMVAMLAEGEK